MFEERLRTERKRVAAIVLACLAAVTLTITATGDVTGDGLSPAITVPGN